MQAMWQRIPAGNQAEETYKNSLWGEILQVRPMQVCINNSKPLKEHFKTHGGEKSYKCSQCHFASARADALRKHLKIHTGVRPGLHKLWYPVVRDMSTWSKFGAHGEHADVFLFSNLGAL